MRISINYLDRAWCHISITHHKYQHSYTFDEVVIDRAGGNHDFAQVTFKYNGYVCGVCINQKVVDEILDFIKDKPEIKAEVIDD